jgi:RNA polymerase sigma-70 factor (ECF subfamily)
LQNISDPDSSIDFSDRDDARRIRKIMHSLQDPYKEVFMWRVFGELSFKEIGDIYGKSDNWACVTYHRAVKMIQKRLEERK